MFLSLLAISSLCVSVVGDLLCSTIARSVCTLCCSRSGLCVACANWLCNTTSKKGQKFNDGIEQKNLRRSMTKIYFAVSSYIFYIVHVDYS